MAYEEIGGNGGGEYEERERFSLRVGDSVEGTFRRMSRLQPSKYGDGLSYRFVDIDRLDGVKGVILAGKILLERLEAADLHDGDRVKIVITEATSGAGRVYALPKLFVDRAGSAPAPAAAPAAAPARRVLDDEPPF